MDSDAVAILPFRIAGPPDAQYLREGMVDLLNVGLDGFAGWRVLQPKAFLRQVDAGSQSLTPAQAALAARQAGAGSFVLGSVTAAGPELVAQAGLYESARGTPLTTVRARGASAQPAAVADSISAGLARYRASRQPGVLRRPTSDYATSSPTALLAYLVAEQAARRGRWPEAIDSLTAAISHDSTFFLAYYELTRAVAWGGFAPTLRVTWGSTSSTLSYDEVYAAALRFKNRAPARQRRLMEALGLSSRVELLRALDELSRAYPEDADIALEASDAYFHMGLQSGQPPAEALARLEHVIAIDPATPEPYLHVVELQSMLGDTASAWQNLGRLRVVAPGWEVLPALELTLRMLRGDSAALAGASREALARGTRYVLWCSDDDPARAIAVADAMSARELAVATSAADRVTVLLRRQGYALARGRYSRAWDLLREAAATDPDGAEVLGMTIVHHLVTRTHEAEAADATRRIMQREGARPMWASILLAWRAATLAPADSARATITALVANGEWRDFRASQVAGLDGLVDLRSGDSAAARRDLVRGISEWIETRGTEIYLPGPLFGVQAARLELAAGDTASALGRLSETIATIGPVYRAEAEELRGIVAERRGDRAAAIRAYSNVVALWQDADPVLQPRVAAARAALARLR